MKAHELPLKAVEKNTTVKAKKPVKKKPRKS